MKDAFELPAELTIYTAQEVRDALLGWIKESSKSRDDALRISAAGVETLDGAGLQLLAALEPMGVEWSLDGASATFATACTLFGVSGWLGDQAAAATGTAPDHAAGH